MDISPVLRLALVPSSFDALWFDMRNQLEDPTYLARLEVEDRKIQGRWRAGTASTLKGLYNRRRNVAATAGDDSSSSSSSASDAYGGGANDTEAGDVNTGAAAAEAAATNAADPSLGTAAAEGPEHADVADDVEIPTDTWMDDGAGLEAFVADVVSSQMDIGGSSVAGSSSNSDNSGMPS